MAEQFINYDNNGVPQKKPFKIKIAGLLNIHRVTFAKDFLAIVSSF